MLDTIRTAVERRHDGAELTPTELASAQQAGTDFFIKPGVSSSFTAGMLANAAGLELQRVERILETFSLTFGDPAVENAVGRFIEGANVLAGIDILSDGRGNHLILQNAIPIDHVRHILNTRLENSPKWETFRKRRDTFAEEYAIDRLRGALGWR